MIRYKKWHIWIVEPFSIWQNKHTVILTSHLQMSTLKKKAGKGSESCDILIMLGTLGTQAWQWITYVYVWVSAVWRGEDSSSNLGGYKKSEQGMHEGWIINAQYMQIHFWWLYFQGFHSTHPCNCSHPSNCSKWTKAFISYAIERGLTAYSALDFSVDDWWCTTTKNRDAAWNFAAIDIPCWLKVPLQSKASEAVLQEAPRVSLLDK